MECIKNLHIQRTFTKKQSERALYIIVIKVKDERENEQSKKRKENIYL